MEKTYLIGAPEIFTVFFIMLGPLRLMGPFAKMTRSLSQPEINSLAWKSVVIIVPLLTVCGFAGMMLLEKWRIPVGILELTAGLIFAYVAFSMILFPKKEDASSNNHSPEVTVLGTALTLILTPYGVASLISLLASSQDRQRTELIFAMLFANIILDFFAMLFIRYLMGKVGRIAMQMLGTVLGVMQAALALFIIHVSLIALHAQM